MLAFLPKDEARVNAALRLLDEVDLVLWRVVRDDATQITVAVWSREHHRWYP